MTTKPASFWPVRTAPHGISHKRQLFPYTRIDADLVIIYPNDEATCAGVNGKVYVSGFFCRKSLMSTGPDDN